MTRSFEAMSRRQMLKGMPKACAALTSTGVLSQMLNMRLTNSVMADVSNVQGYKAMVCLFLFGGMDSFHMLVPNDDDGYAGYTAARGNLALAREDLLPVTSADGRAYGLHPGCADMQTLFNDGDLGFVANVGSLVQPTDMATYNARAGLPVGLFSHNDQQQHWQTAVPQSRSQITGWKGRMADVLTDASNSNDAVAMNISISGLNILQSGDNVVPYVVGTSGAKKLAWYDQNNGWTPIKIYTRSIDNMVDRTYSDLMMRTHANVSRTAIDAALEFEAATGGVELQTVFPSSYLGDQLKMIAKTIAASGTLGQQRQSFFAAAGGWDHHDNMLSNTTGMFPMVSQALKAFNDAMVEIGKQDEVLLFSATDFGRTLSSNGDGSDHAWGGNSIVMGGGVQGGKVHGTFPESLAPGNDLDTGRGRLIPTTSVDEFSAEMAMWFGVPNDGYLETVLPNIRNFYSSGASAPPIGMFS